MADRDVSAKFVADLLAAGKSHPNIAVFDTAEVLLLHELHEWLEQKLLSFL